MYQGPGRYRHYKGGEYEVLGIGVHEHAKEHQPGFDPELPKHQYVVYRPLTQGGLLDGKTPDFWIRGREDFDAEVCPHGEGWDRHEWEPRFRFLRDGRSHSHGTREALDDLRMREEHEQRR